MTTKKGSRVLLAYVLVFALLGALFCPVEAPEGLVALLQQKLLTGGILGAILGLVAGGIIVGKEARQGQTQKTLHRQ